VGLYGLFDQNGLRRAIVDGFLHCALQIGRDVCGNHFGDIIAHFEDIGNAVGAQLSSRAQIRIYPDLHRKLLKYVVLYGDRVIQTHPSCKPTA